ncbi:MAG: hypothetical protein JO235_07700, partial [Chroococcidiopsidaceae cyanobacterium CP_BM_RX_35]|nr:hypothetical protein [Chroococcidiopsidaceae cyanobacterium CP_BM_RX_35]
MDYELRIVVEKVAVSSQEVVNRDTLKVYDVKAPESILELGLRHEEQISLLEKVQNSVLAAQSKLIDTGYDVCPKCGHKLNKTGHAKSNFHAVFTDHQVGIQKHKCRNPECDWQSTPTTTSVFGTSIHPDLAKLQCEQGAIEILHKLGRLRKAQLVVVQPSYKIKSQPESLPSVPIFLCQNPKYFKSADDVFADAA